MLKQHEIQSNSEYAAIRDSYLFWVLVGAALLYAFSLLEGGASDLRLASRLALAILMGLSAWGLRRKRVGGRLLAAVLLTLSWVATMLDGWTQAENTFPNAFIFLPYLSVLGTLLVGAVYGNSLTIVTIAGLWLVILARHDIHDIFYTGHLANLCTVLVAFQVIALSVSKKLAKGAGKLGRHQDELSALQEQVSRLSQTLFKDVAGSLARLKSGLKADGGDLASAAAREMQARLALCRDFLAQDILPNVADNDIRELEGIHHRTLGWFLGLGIVVAVVNLSRGYMMGNPERYTPVYIGLVFFGAGCLAHWRYPRWDRVIAWAVIAPTFGIYCRLFWLWYDVHPGLPANAVFAGLFCVMATLMAGPALSFGLGIVWLAIVTWRTLLDPAAPWVVPFLYVSASGLCSLGLWRLPQHLAAALRPKIDLQLAELARRRSLVATLFHDLANPLQVVLALQALETAGAGKAADRSRMSNMVERMEQVVQATSRQVQGLPLERSRLSANSLLLQLEELYRDRLAGKSLRLDIDFTKDFELFGDEALFRDSVLGNLLSNAIKFSPPGGILEWRLAEAAGKLEFTLQDRGPGIPDDVLADLQRAGACRTRPGSQGETGHGLGLALARDYLQRMGGGLELGKRDGGGTVARAWIPANAGSKA